MHEREVKNCLGLAMDGEFDYSSPQDANRHYNYIELPASGLFNTSDESLVTKALRNQYIQVVVPAQYSIRGSNRFEVHPNPALSKFGAVQAPFYLEPGDSGTPSFHLWLRKDLDLEEIDWAVRIYMRR
jgi:hypothetical protein